MIYYNLGFIFVAQAIYPIGYDNIVPTKVFAELTNAKTDNYTGGKQTNSFDR